MLHAVLLFASAFVVPPSPRSVRAPLARVLAPTMNLVLDEENARRILAECQEELGTLFGSNAESRQVGITGAVEFVDLEGPSVVVRFTGRFWHARAAVLERIESYVLERIPEAVSVEIEDPKMLDDADPYEPPTSIDDL